MIVDSSGSRCPQPIIDIARALNNNPDINEFRLLSDDPATWPDLQAWARMKGHRVEKSHGDESETPSYLVWR